MAEDEEDVENTVVFFLEIVVLHWNWFAEDFSRNSKIRENIFSSWLREHACNWRRARLLRFSLLSVSNAVGIWLCAFAVFIMSLLLLIIYFSVPYFFLSPSTLFIYLLIINHLVCFLSSPFGLISLFCPTENCVLVWLERYLLTSIFFCSMIYKSNDNRLG